MRKPVGIGVSVLIKHQGKMLFILRNGAHGYGQWSCPGGHIDFGETALNAAKRESLEEVGVSIGAIHFVGYTDDFFVDTDKHYVTLWYVADWISGEAHIAEPKEVQEVRWLHLSEIPGDLFLPLANAVRKFPEIFA